MESSLSSVFLLYQNGELIGTCGVYVDDFLITGKDSNPVWQNAKKKLVDLYTWGKWERRIFHLCGVRYKQHRDYSITLDQEDYTTSLIEPDFNPPSDLKKQEAARRLG